MINSQFLILILIATLFAAVPALLPQWTFDQEPVGGLPRDWSARGGSAEGVYQITAEANGNRYLAAKSQGSDVQFGTELSIEPSPQLTLSWRWRVWELPPRASEASLTTMDSAAAVYVAFGNRFLPRVLKYVWSSTLPVGTMLKHPRSNRLAIIVVASGQQSIGAWQPVKRNLSEDCRAAFGTDLALIRALGIKTDSDSTRTSARADYDDLRFAAGAN